MTDFEAMRITVFQDTTVAARVRRRYANYRVAGMQPMTTPGGVDDMPTYRRIARQRRRGRAVHRESRLGRLLAGRRPQPHDARHPRARAEGARGHARPQVGDPALEGLHSRSRNPWLQGRVAGGAPRQRRDLLRRCARAGRDDVELHRIGRESRSTRATSARRMRTLRSTPKAPSALPRTAAGLPSATPTISAPASIGSRASRAAITCSATSRRTPRPTASSAGSRSR